jgi:O-antigen/teichoic acid export membrane protein
VSTALALPEEPARLRRAWWIHLASCMGAVLSQFLIGLVLARLLAPAELGLFATAGAIIAMAQLLRDLGISSFLQREPALDAAGFGACVGLQIVTTSLLSLLLWLAAEGLARQFRQPELAGLLRILILVLVLTPFGSLLAALHLRDLNATQLAWVTRVGNLSWGVAAVSLALLGQGARGLAWAQVVQAVACTAAHGWLRPRHLDWRPRWTGWSRMLRFGTGAFGQQLLASLNAQLPDLLLGRIGGMAQLALMGRANALVGLFNSVADGAIGFGSLPLFSRRHADGEALAPWIERASQWVTGLAWPLLALTVLLREPLLALLFGPAWLGAGAAVTPLAVVMALVLLMRHANLALVAIGRPHLPAALNAGLLGARILLALLCFDGSLASFAWALAAAQVLLLPVQAWVMARHLALAPGAFLRAQWRSAAVCGLCVVAAAAGSSPWISGLAAGLAWLPALYLCGHPLWAELRLQLARLRSTTRK